MTKFIVLVSKKNEREFNFFKKRIRKHNLAGVHDPYDDMIYSLNSEHHMARLSAALRPGDTIECHGHGMPWSIGGEYANPLFDRDPILLAKNLTSIIDNSDMSLTIDLMCCFSGTKVSVIDKNGEERGTLCFAKELSRHLRRLEYHDITVYGYKGAINENMNSVGPYSEQRGKAHARLSDARVQYKNGHCLHKAKTDILTSEEYERLTCFPSTLEGNLLKERFFPLAKKQSCSHPLRQFSLLNTRASMPEGEAVPLKNSTSLLA